MLAGGGAGMIRKARAAEKDISPQAGVETTVVRSVCTHCSVGCGVMAEVQNGVWTGQEPDYDSPINLGAHCAKGAAVREHGHGERRLKYPMKLVGGKWRKVSWEQAIDEIGDTMLQIREESGPDSVYWLGSAKHSNEQAYLFRKFAALWGTNNVDHQARICHSTTVAGVANTWGYGAMTNSYNDMQNSKAMFFIGSNAAEAHPVAMQHVLKAKENGSKLIVVDPRFTRTAAHSDQFVSIRPGTDVPVIWGMLWHIFENGWEDAEYIAQRVYGMDEIRAEVAKWTPEEVERVSGVPGAQLEQAARTHGREQAGHHRLVHGRHAAHHRQQQHARLLRAAARARQHRRGRRRCEHLPRPLQRAGRDGPRRAVAHAPRLLRSRRGLVEALGQGLGHRLRLAAGPLRLGGLRGEGRRGPEAHEHRRHAGVALDRRRAGGPRQHRAERQPARDGVSAATRRTARRGSPR